MGADDWIAEAYERFRAEGLSAVRVEAVARGLGVSKGSFYWHFAARGELVEAVIRRWEDEETEALIRLAEAAGDAPEPRLRALFDAVAARRAQGSDGELRLYLDADREGVREAVERISLRRIAYLAGILEELGQAPEEARTRSSIALAAAVGFGTIAPYLPPGPALTETLLDMVLGTPSPTQPQKP